MSTDQDKLLAARFAALAPEPLAADWDEVLDRAGAAAAWDDVLARADAAPVTGPRQATTGWLPRGHRRRVLLAFALVVVGVVATGSALATLGDHLGITAGHRPGSLDTSFGRGGKVMTRIGSGGAGASALAIEKNGKLVAAGTTNTRPIGGNDSGINAFALVRYHANGTLDGSFGRGGKVTTPICPCRGISFGGPHPGGAVASAVAIQQDGKLVAAGGTHDLVYGDFALARYNANGTLDRSFGRGGIVTTCCSGAFALAIQQDGKLVAAGGGGNGFALVRYHANGTLDRSFGRGGKVTTPLASGGAASALAIQQDGKLVAAGTTQCCFGGDLALVRYNANGTLDTSFGRSGKVTTPIGSGDADPPALAIQQDGKLVVAAGNRSNNRLVLVRYNANGTLDTSFGRGGKVTTPIAPSGIGGVDGRSALAIQQDGKLVAAGRSNNRFALVRYNANGTLDGIFGRMTPTGGVSALAIQQDGKLVAAGGSNNGFALVRYWP